MERFYPSLFPRQGLSQGRRHVANAAGARYSMAAETHAGAGRAGKRRMDSRKRSVASDATAVFGLTQRQLQTILDEIAGEKVAAFTVAVNYEVRGHRGYSADKIIPTFSWTAKSGRTGETTVFVKWFRTAGPHEAYHYEWLARCHAPIPRMYGSLVTPDKREMIFLEHLDYVDAMHPFDAFLLDAEKFPKFLQAVARFNAVKAPAEYVNSLPKWKCAEALEGAQSTLESLWSHAAEGDLGDQLARLCAKHKGKLERLKALAKEVASPIDLMEAGLCHNDLSPDSTCWDPRTGEAVVIDLESVGMGPRFRDAAKYLGAPDEVLRRCLPQKELVRHYLGEYARAGGVDATVDQFIAEARPLWLAGILEMMWFSLARAIDGRVDWTEDAGEGRRAFREDLYNTIKALIGEVL